MSAPIKENLYKVVMQKKEKFSQYLDPEERFFSCVVDATSPFQAADKALKSVKVKQYIDLPYVYEIIKLWENATTAVRSLMEQLFYAESVKVWISSMALLWLFTTRCRVTSSRP